METAEKELLQMIIRMTKDEWQQLRADMQGDDKIMGLLEVIGQQKGWESDGI